MRNILSLYIGWVAVAGTVIIGLTLVYAIGVSLCVEFILFWITTPIAATAIYLFMATKEKGEAKYCIGYLFAILWGVIGTSLASYENIV